MLKACNITKKYEQSNFTIEDLSLCLEDTGMTFLCGQSGSGKSTLLNILSTLEKADSGSLFFNNINLTNLNEYNLSEYRKNSIGFIFQNFNLYDDLTVLDNVLIQLKLQRKQINIKDIDDVLKQVELLEFKNTSVSKLSGGQKQRVGIARALIKKPRILFCDEPTGALDSKTSTEIFKILKEISKTTLVVVASHDEETVKKYGDRIICISDGKICSDSKQSGFENNNSENNNDIKYKGSPLSVTAKLSFLNFFKKPTHLIVSSILSFLTLSVINVSVGFADTNRNSAVINAVSKSGLNYVEVKKEMHMHSSTTGEDNTIVKINDDEINEILTISNSDFVLPCYSFFQQVPFGSVINQNYVDNDSYTIYGTCELDEKIVSGFGFNVIEGKLPENEDEIVITTNQCDAILKYGIVLNTSELLEIDNFNELLGKKISLRRSFCNDEWNFTISGIIDTGISNNLSKYIDEEFVDTYKKQASAGFENCVFVNKETIEKLRYKNSKSLNVLISCNADDQLFKNGHLGLSNLRTFDKIEQKYFFEGFNEEGLTNRDCLASITSLNTTGEATSIANKALISMVEHYSPGSYVSRVSECMPLERYYSNFKQCNGLSNLFTFDEFVNEFSKEISKVINSAVDTTISFENNKTEKYRIVGIYDETEKYGYDYSISLAICDETLKHIYESFDCRNFDCISAFVPLTANLDTNKTIIDKINNYKNTHLEEYHKEIVSGYSFDNLTYKYSSLFQPTYDLYAPHIQIVKIFSIILSLILGAFLFLFLYLFFNGQAKLKEKDIAILRTLGASKTDVFKIFLLQNFALWFGMAILGLVGTFILSSIIINIPFFNFVNFLYLLDINPLKVILVLVVAFGVSLLGITIPFIKITKKSPIDVLKCEE